MTTTAEQRPALIEPAEAARLLGTTPGTLSVWRCTKRYPLAFVRVGRRVRYRLSDVEKFIESRTERPVDLGE